MIFYVSMSIQTKQSIKIAGLFRVKEGSIKSPDMYLGMSVRRWTVQNHDGSEKQCFAIGATSYVKEAVRTAKLQVSKHDLIFPMSKKSGRTPFSNIKYRPELDATDFCDEDQHTLF